MLTILLTGTSNDYTTAASVSSSAIPATPISPTLPVEVGLVIGIILRRSVCGNTNISNTLQDSALPLIEYDKQLFLELAELWLRAAVGCTWNTWSRGKSSMVSMFRCSHFC